VDDGELDDTELTLRELDAIADSFAATLRGFYHPRVQYPQLETTRPALGAVLVSPPGQLKKPEEAAFPKEATRPIISHESKPNS
jgi:hypothetical protein